MQLDWGAQCNLKSFLSHGECITHELKRVPKSLLTDKEQLVLSLGRRFHHRHRLPADALHLTRDAHRPLLGVELVGLRRVGDLAGRAIRRRQPQEWAPASRRRA